MIEQVVSLHLKNSHYHIDIVIATEDRLMWVYAVRGKVVTDIIHLILGVLARSEKVVDQVQPAEIGKSALSGKIFTCLFLCSNHSNYLYYPYIIESESGLDHFR